MTGAQITKKAASAAEPLRVKKFRLELVTTSPRVPNNRDSLQHMQQKRLSDVLIDYVHWRARYVGKRPRQVEIEAAAKAGPRWPAMATAIETLLEKVRNGDDLTPHLSLQPHTRGYSLAARTPGATNEDRWSDKDFFLTRMNYHNFHLGTGRTGRTDDLVLAEVSRDKFKVIAIFGHDVFKEGSTERTRLSALHQQIIFRSLPPSSGVLDGPVTCSGHAMHVVMYGLHCERMIKSVDPQIDDSAYVESLYAQGNISIPCGPKLRWKFLHLDLALYDTASRTAFLMQKGWN
jgi:hypothetical protein